MFRFAIERPVILTVGILILTLFGILSIFQVPIQMIPDLDARIISVSTTWPGASPQDVEKEILVEQEKYLGRIPGLENMVSTANTGTADLGNVMAAGLSSAQLHADLAGSIYAISIPGGGGGGSLDIIWVPEPSTMMLLALGLIAVLWRPRRT